MCSMTLGNTSKALYILEKLQKQPAADVFQNRFYNIYRETPVLKSLFHKDAGIQVCNFIEKILQHRCFPLNITKFLRTAYLIDLNRWLLFQVERTIIYKTVLWSNWSSGSVFISVQGWI